MPIFTIVVPEITADKKDEFLSHWPELISELKSQPGVASATGGQIVADDNGEVKDFKFVETLAFNSFEDEEKFGNSAWAKEHQALYETHVGGEPTVGRFEVEDLPVGAARKPFIQFSSIILSDESKREAATKAWTDVSAALGREMWGGRRVENDPPVGLAVIDWASLEEADAAYKDPKVAAAFDIFKALGEVKNVFVKLE